MAAFGALLDPTAEAPDTDAPSWLPTPLPYAAELLRDNLRRRRLELRRGWSGLVHPARTLRIARRALPAWREVLTDKPAPQTSLNHPVGTERRLAIVRGRLEVAKQIAHVHNTKAGDVVLAAVAGGLRQLLVSRGEDVDGMVTVSQHYEQPDQAQGNKPGWRMVPLPLRERCGTSARVDRGGDGRAEEPGSPRGGQRNLSIRRMPARLVSAVSPAAVSESGREQRSGGRPCRYISPARGCWRCSRRCRPWAT
jgi:hypothetical protein